MPQDTGDEELEAARAADAQARADKASEMSVGGLVENIGNDAFDLLKGLYSIVPTIGNSIRKIWQDRQYIPQMLANPETLTKSLGDTASAVKDSIIEPYQKYGLKVLYHRPVGTLLDALTIFDLGAGSLAKSGKWLMLPDVERAGIRLGELPSKLVRGGIDAAAFKISGGSLDLAQDRAYRSVIRGIKGNANKMFESDMENYGNAVKGLNDDEAALFHKIRTQGGSLEEVAPFPRVMDAYDKYQKLVNGWQDYLKSTGHLDDARIADALVKKYMAETGSTAEEAASAIGKAQIKPIYGKAMRPGGGSFVDVEDLLTAPKVGKAGKVPFLERFTGALEATKDPRKYVPSAIKAFRDFESKLTIIDEVLGNPEKFGVRAVKAGEAALHEIMPEGIFKKYLEDKRRPNSVAMEEQLRAKGTGALAEELSTNAETRKAVAQAVNITVDPTVRRLLRWEFASVNHPAIRLYDRILSLFKLTATKLNPGYYTGNAVGDAIFGVLGGAKSLEGAALQARGLMPASVTHVGTMGGHGRLIGNIPDLANEADVAVRLGLMTRGMADEFVKTGMSMAQAMPEVERALQAVAQYPEMRNLIRRSMERVSSSSREVSALDRRIGRLTAKERKLSAEVSSAENPKALIAAEHKALVSGKKSSNRRIREKTLDASRSVRDLEAQLQGVHEELGKLIHRRESVIRDIADDLMKADPAIKQSAELQKDLAIVNKGVDLSNMFVGDYLGMDGFQQGVLRRLIPFYAFTQTMTKLAFRLPFYAPVKTFLWHRYAMAMWSMIGDKDLPDYMNGYVPVMARENGDLVWMKLTRFSPFNSLKMKEFGGIPIPNLIDIAAQNPLIGLAFKSEGGRTVFDRSAIPYGESMVNISNGDVYEYTQDGKLRKTIPQSPFISNVVHMFPITQLIEDVISPYRANSYNMVGLPEPAMNPDGSYRAPREWWQRLGAVAGFNLMGRSREDLIRSEKIKIHQVLMSMRKSYRRADPEERKFFTQAFRDYAAGQLRIDSE